MWLSKQLRPAAPTADADLGTTTIAGDSAGVITRGEVNARTTEWANSIIMDGTNKKNNTAEVVEMTLVPMWSFFEGAAADAVKKYIVDKYKDNPKCMVDFSDY